MVQPVPISQGKRSSPQVVAKAEYREPKFKNNSLPKVYLNKGLSEQEKLKELLICKASFPDFLEKYVKVLRPPTIENVGGYIGFEMPPHIKELIWHLLKTRMVVIIKSRQVYISTTLAAWALWRVLFFQGTLGLVFSKGELEAKEFISKAKRVYYNLPLWMQELLEMKPDSTEAIGFPENSSILQSFPSTEAAGIGFTGSFVITDEWDFHPFDRLNYHNVHPTIASSGGQWIGCTSVNPFNPNSLAKQIYREAVKGNNDFVPLFFPWNSVPSRDQAWYDYTLRNQAPEDLNGLAPLEAMQRNYPRVIEEALAPTQISAAFDQNVLNAMMGETRNPIRLFKDSIDDKIIGVYKPWSIGEVYVAASDTGHGVGKDYSVTLILNVRTGEVVADIVSNRIAPDEFAFHSVKLLEIYKNPIWYPEDNDWGQVVINTAERLEYRNFGYQDDARTKKGFHTGKNREMLWGNLIPAINNRQIVIYNHNGLAQFYDVIRSREGRIEASQGKNDDYPMALGIAWLKRQKTLTGSAQVITSSAKRQLVRW